MLKRVMRAVPVRTGNNISWFMLALSLGFIIGWVSAVEYLREVYFPIV